MTLVFDHIAPGTRPHRHHSVPRGKTNDRLGYALLLLLALSPLPLGSNRPIFWSIWGLLIGIIGIAYYVSLRHSGAGLRVTPLRVPELFIPFVLLVGFLIVQILPLGSLGYQTVHALANGGTVRSPTISLDPASTFLSVLQIASYGLVACLFLQAGYRSGRTHTLITGMFVIIVGYALFGLVLLGQFGPDLLGTLVQQGERVATGPFINRNSFATYLSFGLAIGTALAVSRFGKDEGARHRYRATMTIALAAMGLLVVGVALVATQSRMGVFAGLCGALVVTLLALVGSRSRVSIWLLLLAAILAGFVGLLVFNGQGLLERVGSIEGAGDIRLDLYRQVWGMVMASPYLGYGGGAFETAFPLFHQLPVDPDLVWRKTHSTYLALWSELGLVAGSIPLFVAGAATVRIALSRERGTTRPVRLAALGVVTVAAVHSLVDFSLEIQAVALVFVAVLSVAVGSSIGDSERRKRDA